MTPPADYYEQLGVGRSASSDELKSAYRRLARELHPDVNPDPEAAERFKSVSEAYAVLRDPDKRARYDAYGVAGVRGGAAADGDPFSAIFTDFPDLADFFGAVFGGRARPRGPQVHPGDSLRADADLTFEEAYLGAERVLQVTRRRPCKTCDGRGSASGAAPVACVTCGGAGQVQSVTRGPFGMQMSTVFPCTRCGGDGWVVADPCRTCDGSGLQRVRETVTVEIPAGVENGERLRVEGEGDTGPRNGPPGDLIVVLHVRSDPRFRRRGTELITTAALPFTVAALGGTLEVETVDGLTTVDIPTGTQSGTTIRVPVKGMPDPHTGRRGDLHVVIYVSVPRRLTKEQKRILQQFRDAGGDRISDDEDTKGFFERLREALGRD